MAMMVPITEAKARLNELVRNAADSDVLLMRHGNVAGVLISPERLGAILEDLEDARDRLSVYEAEPAELNISLDKVKAELGLL